MNIAVKPRAGQSKGRASRMPAAEWKTRVPSLGSKDVLVLRNRGLIACGRTIAEAFRRIYHLENACRLQLDVMATNRPFAPPPPAVCEQAARQWEAGAAGIGTGRDEATREWPAMPTRNFEFFPGVGMGPRLRGDDKNIEVSTLSEVPQVPLPSGFPQPPLTASPDSRALARGRQGGSAIQRRTGGLTFIL